jgi:hypothetical protein
MCVCVYVYTAHIYAVHTYPCIMTCLKTRQVKSATKRKSFNSKPFTKLLTKRRYDDTELRRSSILYSSRTVSIAPRHKITDERYNVPSVL